MNLRPNAPSSPQGELPIPSAPQQREADVSTSDAIAKTKSTAAAARATPAKPKAATGLSRKMSSLRSTDQEGDQPPPEVNLLPGQGAVAEEALQQLDGRIHREIGRES